MARVNQPVSYSSEVLMSAVIWAMVLAVVAALLWLLGDIWIQGIDAITWQFLTTPPLNAGRAGGIAPILASTAWIVGVCLAVSLPLGVGTAIWLAEFSDRTSGLGRAVQFSLAVLAGVPSIVFGLFGNAFFSKTLGLGFSILSGGLTLACMVLPILIQATQAGLRAVPDDYRRSGAALGLSRTALLWQLLLPAALPGIEVGVLLGFGRAIAETAALIFTSGYVDRWPESVWDSGRALSVHIFDLAMNVAGGETNAYGTALVVIGIVVTVNGLVSWVGDRVQHSRLSVK